MVLSAPACLSLSRVQRRPRSPESVPPKRFREVSYCPVLHFRRGVQQDSKGRSPFSEYRKLVEGLGRPASRPFLLFLGFGAAKPLRPHHVGIEPTYPFSRTAHYHSASDGGFVGVTPECQVRRSPTLFPSKTLWTLKLPVQRFRP